MYMLAENGWQPANGPGYADGLPVDEGFEVARKAHQLMQAGAVYSGYKLLASARLLRPGASLGPLAQLRAVRPH